MAIKLTDIQKTYHSGEVIVSALKNIHMELPDGEITVILGPSGSGKSTLLNVIGGIDHADSGEIVVAGANLKQLKDKELTTYRREHVGFIFQSYNLIPTLTVRENVEVGAEISQKPLAIDEVLNRVGMGDKKHKFPHQLSGGEQQRVAIARALVKNPDLLLCDEPTGALDEHTGKNILSLLQEINEKYNTTIMIITHNPGIGEMANRVVKMKSGELVSIDVNDQPLRAQQVKWV